MQYQITCVCGHRFFAPADQLGNHVTCPVCNRALIPVAATAEADAPANAPGTTAAPAEAQGTKRCPFCGESILAVAKKCRYCGEFLDRAAAVAPATSAPSTPAPEAAPNDQSPPVFSLCVSQWDNFWKYVICITVAVLACGIFFLHIPSSNKILGFLCVLMVDVLTIYFIYLGARSARCVIRPTRIDTEVGIFSKKVDSIALFRVVDVELKQGFIERMLGIGTVVVKSSDENSPVLELYQIPQARKVYQYLQNQLPVAARQSRAVYVER